MSDPHSTAHSFTDIEEEFFRVGTAMSEVDEADSFADLDRDFQRPSLWQRLFSRPQDT